MRFHLYLADCIGNKLNCLYPHSVEITSAQELREATHMDHVSAQYNNNYRNAVNFMFSDCIIMDCDNDFSENPDDWITPEKLAEMMPEYRFAWVPSRHSEQWKENKSPRPRGHMYFPVDLITSAEQNAAMKREINERYPFFDKQALDAARFILGSDNGDVFWHDDCWGFISDILDSANSDTSKTGDNKLCDAGAQTHGNGKESDLFSTRARMHSENSYGGSGSSHERNDEIPEGCRNTTLSRFAARILKRYGEGEKSERIFLEHADKCNPPLDDAELASVWGSALKFYRNKVVNQDDYISPDEYVDFSEYGYEYYKPEDYSDIGESRAFLKEYGTELISTQETQWLRYDGTKWYECDQLAVSALKEFMDLQLREAIEGVEAITAEFAGLGEDNVLLLHKSSYTSRFTGKKLEANAKLEAAEEYLKFVRKRRNMSYVNATLEAARSDVFASINDMDQDAFLLNTPGMTYDLSLGMNGGRIPKAADRITKITMTAPGAEGEEIWKTALDTFFCNDQELIDYVQKMVGLAAIGKVYQEALIIAYGDGRNGKSTFWNTIRRVMGEYGGNIPASVLTGTYKENKSAVLAELKGERLVIAAELEEGLRLSTSTLKQLCSTDEINACKKFECPFDFTPTHTLVLYTNHLPKVGAMDNGTWRRLIVIPFKATMEGNSDILNYTDYLLQNAAPAVMKWIIEGAQKIISLNFKAEMPKCVQETIDEYRGSNNWLEAFLEDSCEVGPGLSVKSGELYNSFRMFCKRTGEFTRTGSDFVAALEQAGFERKRNKDGVIIYGLSQKSEMKGDFLP